MVRARTRAFRASAALATVVALGFGGAVAGAPPVAAQKMVVINAPGYPPPPVLSIRVKLKKDMLRVAFKPPSKKPPYIFRVAILGSDGSTVLTWGVTQEHHLSFLRTDTMHGTLYARVVVEDQYGQTSGAAFHEILLP